MQREAGGVVVRLLQPVAPREVTASLDHDEQPATGWVVDLLGAPLEAFDGELDLRPAEIVTLRLYLITRRRRSRRRPGPANPGRSRVPARLDHRVGHRRSCGR